MKNKFSKRTSVLICVAALLALVYIIQLLAGLKSPQKTFRIKDAPDSISIENAGTTIVIQKNGDSWFSGGNELDQSKIDYLLKDFTSVKTLNLASRSDKPATLERYGLDKPIVFQGKSGAKDLRTILIGKESVSGSQCYIQFKGKKEIYLAQGNLRKDCSFKLDDIKKKTDEEKTEKAPIEIHGENGDAVNTAESGQ